MIQAICKALMHSLWQGLVFSIVTGLFLLYGKRLTAAIRYLVLSSLFFLLLATCGATLLWELYSLGSDQGSSVAGTEGGGMLSPFLYAVNVFCTEHASMIVLGWFLVFAFRSLRMATGLAYTFRIRHSGTGQAPIYWKRKLRQLSRHLKIKKTVSLLESKIVNMPMVIGHLRPVIFIPLGLLTQLPEREIEAVLLHELAHIRRQDYFVNFLQQIAENVMFFNPGLLWISALLREERENCCDDIAIGYTGDKTTFIRALVTFKQHTEQTRGLAVAFPSRRHQLLHRVLRIAHDRNKSLSAGERLFFIGSCLVMAALLASLNSPVPTSDTRLYTLRTKEQPAASPDQQSAGAEQLATIHAEQLALAKKEQYELMEKELAESAARGARDRLPNTNGQMAETSVVPNTEEEMQKIRQEKEDLTRAQEAYDRAREDMKAKQDVIGKLLLLQADQEEIKQQEDQLLADKDMQEAKIKMEQLIVAREQAEKVERQQALRDANQNVKDQEQAVIDQARAVNDQFQAERDRLQMIKDKQSAGKQKTRTTQKK